MNIDYIQAAHISTSNDPESCNFSRYIVKVEVGGVFFDLDVYVNHDNDDYVEFDTPEELREGMTGEDSDELFMAVLAAIND